jgi:hypothetical protein
MVTLEEYEDDLDALADAGTPVAPQQPILTPNLQSTIALMLKNQQAAEAEKKAAEAEKRAALRKRLEAVEAVPQKMNLQGAYNVYQALFDKKIPYEAPTDERQKALDLFNLESKIPIAAGSNSNAANTTLGLLAKMQKGQDRQNSAQARKTDRIDRMMHAKVIDNLNKDQVLRQRLTQFQNIDNAFAMLLNPDKIPYQNLNEFQQAMRSNMGIKGTGGVDERTKTYFNGLGINLAAIDQFLTMKPRDLSEYKELMQHLSQTALIEQANAQKQAVSRKNFLGSGFGSVYARRPELFGDLLEKNKALDEQFKNNRMEQAEKRFGVDPRTVLGDQGQDKKPGGGQKPERDQFPEGLEGSKAYLKAMKAFNGAK